MKSTNFITDNFVLQSDVAETLYHKYAKDLPIIDYHNHLSPQLIAEDQPLKNITEAWLNGDHYKWRAMRANGIDEIFITGSATSHKEKFLKWAETVPKTIRNPLFHWTHLELKRYFDIDNLLHPDTAEEIYEKANAILENKTPAQLLEDLKVEVVCTTDDPIDDLKYHQEIAEKGFFTKVFPTFRPDSMLQMLNGNSLVYIEKLIGCVGFKINDFESFLKAIDKRIDFFHDNGCRLSDYGISGAFTFAEHTEDEVNSIFNKFLNGEHLNNVEVEKYKTYLSLYLGRKYHEKGWVQQYHLGVIRNNNTRLQNIVGLDAGCDSIGDFPIIEGLSKFLNTLNESNQLAKTITYNLNPAQNETFATMMGNFQNAQYPGKMQWGSGWWFLDQKDGMEKQINCLSNMGLLSRFVGMLTDSRSFLSFPRHEYFRRILCNLLGEDVKQGLIPNDIEFLGKMVQDICYYNAKNYFSFKTK
ncbi:glucuronate isomerase [Hyunsoonleella jejuensis]|uniref:Uronate isomerase n=1 Tax=Hyunsoonleella jejuensis TaxID=419940 RepID=A0A1H9ILU3_9FLAO|nr:glucuronate isomerase [Hyunsoonleella jejuensis]SEQ75355.1 glucuronate isomerase [Hyunsoonleella jejuensis]